MRTQPFEVAISGQTIGVRGDVDLAVADQLVDLVTTLAQRVPAGTVTLDLARLTSIDSTGIAALIRTQQKLEELGKEAEISNTPERIRRIFFIAGVGELLNVRPEAPA